MSAQVQEMDKGEGLMIVSGSTATVIGNPGMVHAQFFAGVQHLGNEHRKAGSPRSAGWLGQQLDV